MKSENSLMEWAVKNGSKYLKERIGGGYSWARLAKNEYVASIMNGVDLGMKSVVEEEDWDEQKPFTVATECIDPTKGQLKTIKRVRSMFPKDENIRILPALIEHIPAMPTDVHAELSAKEEHYRAAGWSGPGTRLLDHWKSDNAEYTEGLTIVILFPTGSEARLHYDLGVKRNYREDN